LNFLNAVILGIVQGLTEFLPISSSAHVQIVETLLGLNTSTGITKAQLTAFIATIQLGTELAVLIFFWRDITRIISAFFGGLFGAREKGKDYKLGWLIIIGSLPVIVIGLAFKHVIENDLRNLWVISATLIGFGLVLGLADRVGKKQRSINSLTTRDGVLFGLGQALAVIPGVSRSGGTISVGLFLGYTREAAARYSFLLAIPAVLASGLYEFYGSYKDLPNDLLVATAISTVVSFAIGYAVIAVLLRYLNRGSFMPFVIWRVLVGVALIAGLSQGFLSA
jgi:undecaprenyl-diphosphatase